MIHPNLLNGFLMEKSHLLVTKHDDNVFVKVDNEVIECSKTVKLLGIIIDNRLNFTEHI